MYYSNLFYIFSILGFIIEKIVNPSRDSGILYGFWTPVYGLGVVVTIFIYNFINNKYKLAGLKKFIISFLIGFIILSTLEFLGGFLVEKFLRITFWDYSKEKFSIGRYTSLKMAFIWSISSIFIIYIIKPISEKFIKKIPKLITYIFIIIYIIDCILKFSPYLTK
ncbi:MAG: putative ABC transporter permease [bacterium]|nr:putative ABC transporter permease [bacterium]